MTCLLCCTLLICIPIYMATENLILSLILSFGLFGLACYIFGKAGTDAIEKKETDYYDSLNLNPTKEIHCTASNYDVYSVNLLHTEKELVIVNKTAKNVIRIKYQDIIRCDVQQDNSTIMESSAGNALAGGILFGATGAIIGAASKSSRDVCSNLSIRIITNEILSPAVTIPLIQSNVNRQSVTYRNLIQFADEVYSTIVAIIHENNRLQMVPQSYNMFSQVQNPMSVPPTNMPTIDTPNKVEQANDNKPNQNVQMLPGQYGQTPFSAPSYDTNDLSFAHLPDLSNQYQNSPQVNYPNRRTTKSYQWNYTDSSKLNQNNNK